MSVNKYNNGELEPIAGRVPVDVALSETSNNPVANKAVATAIKDVNNNLVTLASKLIYGGNAKKIEVMSDATNLFQIRIWVSDTKAYVLVCNSNNIDLKLYENSTWSNIWSK